MPQVAYANTFEVRVHGVFYGEEMVNTYHLLSPTAPADLDTAETAAVITPFVNLYTNGATDTPPGINDFLSGDMTVDFVTLQDQRSLPYPSPSIQTTTIPGGGGGVGLPVDVSLCVSLYTPVASRSGRGRVFLGPHPTSIVSITGNPAPGWTAATRTDVAEAFDALQDALLAITTPFALGVRSVVDGVTRPVFRVRVDGSPDTQRRRDRGIVFPFADQALAQLP